MRTATASIAQRMQFAGLQFRANACASASAHSRVLQLQPTLRQAHRRIERLVGHSNADDAADASAALTETLSGATSNLFAS